MRYKGSAVVPQGQADVALRRLAEVASRTGRDTQRELSVLEAALAKSLTVDEATVDRVARRLWSVWRNVDERGFVATSPENREQWRALAREALGVVGVRIDPSTPRRGRRRPAGRDPST
ncbi:MAG TPA: hypothetical protein VF039_02305 [Longimicrobiales bacterium]